MEIPDLKPCQAIVRGTVLWSGDWQRNYFVCRAECAKTDRHVEARASQECFDCLVRSVMERDVMHELCKGCKEVRNDANTND